MASNKEEACKAVNEIMQVSRNVQAPIGRVLTKQQKKKLLSLSKSEMLFFFPFISI